MVFIGRDEELGMLERYYRSESVRTCAIYGRRRVGKTTLMERFCEDKPTLWFNLIGTDPDRVMDNAASVVAGFTGDDPEDVRGRMRDFDDIVGFLETLDPEERLVVVMDEFPDAVGLFRDVPACLMRYIDGRMKRQNLFLMICGSSVSSMVRELNEGSRPLFQRFPVQMRVSPLPYREARRFHPGLSEEEAVRMYAIASGVPLYHELMSAYPSAQEAIEGLFLAKAGALYGEARSALALEVSPLSTYNRVLSLIGGGVEDLNDLAGRAGLSKTRCREIMDTLEMLDVVARRPMYRGRSSPYHIRDGFLGFYYSVICGNEALLDMRPSDAFNALRPRIDTYYGRRFEDVCREFVMSTEVCTWCGGWRGKVPVIEDGAILRGADGRAVTTATDIDVVAKVVRSDLTLVMMCECKFTSRRCGIRELEELRESVGHAMLGGENLEYVLFSRSGFSSELSDLSESDRRVRLVSLEDIGRWAGCVDSG